MKVSRKVGRRSRKHASSVSVSRRRLRNKKSKSGYRKKHAKTQRGGKRGKCTRTRSRGYKRGRRFHRGGVFGDGIELQTYLPPTIASDTEGSGDDDANIALPPKTNRAKVPISSVPTTIAPDPTSSDTAPLAKSSCDISFLTDDDSEFYKKKYKSQLIYSEMLRDPDITGMFSTPDIVAFTECFIQMYSSEIKAFTESDKVSKFVEAKVNMLLPLPPLTGDAIKRASYDLQTYYQELLKIILISKIYSDKGFEYTINYPNVLRIIPQIKALHEVINNPSQYLLGH